MTNSNNRKCDADSLFMDFAEQWKPHMKENLGGLSPNPTAIDDNHNKQSSQGGGSQTTKGHGGHNNPQDASHGSDSEPNKSDDEKNQGSAKQGSSLRYSDARAEKEVAEYLDAKLYEDFKRRGWKFIRERRKKEQVDGIDCTLEKEGIKWIVDEKAALHDINRSENDEVKPVNRFFLECDYLSKKKNYKPNDEPNGWFLLPDLETNAYIFCSIEANTDMYPKLLESSLDEQEFELAGKKMKKYFKTLEAEDIVGMKCIFIEKEKVKDYIYKTINERSYFEGEDAKDKVIRIVKGCRDYSEKIEYKQDRISKIAKGCRMYKRNGCDDESMNKKGYEQAEINEIKVILENMGTIDYETSPKIDLYEKINGVKSCREYMRSKGYNLDEIKEIERYLYREGSKNDELMFTVSNLDEKPITIAIKRKVLKEMALADDSKDSILGYYEITGKINAAKEPTVDRITEPHR